MLRREVSSSCCTTRRLLNRCAARCSVFKREAAAKLLISVRAACSAREISERVERSRYETRSQLCDTNDAIWYAMCRLRSPKTSSPQNGQIGACAPRLMAVGSGAVRMHCAMSCSCSASNDVSSAACAAREAKHSEKAAADSQTPARSGPKVAAMLGEQGEAVDLAVGATDVRTGHVDRVAWEDGGVRAAPVHPRESAGRGSQRERGTTHVAA